MRLKRRRCEERATGNGNEYLFAGTFGNIEGFSLDENGCDPAIFGLEIVDGSMPPSKIKAFLTHTLTHVNGVDADKIDAEKEVERFIEDFGLEDSARFCTLVLSHAIIGDIKKKRQKRKLLVSIMTSKMYHLTLKVIKKPGYIWATILLILLIVICTNFSYVSTLTNLFQG